MIEASCHCGAIKLSVAQLPSTLTECNCSICRRLGAQWAYFSPAEVEISGDPAARGGYCWGDKEIVFVHCKHCGCVTHYESVDQAADGRIAINARGIDPALSAGIKIRHFDGADSWTFMDQPD